MRGLRAVTVSRVGFVVQCALAAVILVVAGYASKVVGLTSALGDGVALGSSPPLLSSPSAFGSSPSVGAMNILVMGLESRTNFQGQDLSAQQLKETHSGNAAQVAAGLEGRRTPTR